MTKNCISTIFWHPYMSNNLTLPLSFRARGLCFESPDNFSGPKSCFMFVVLALKIKASIILKLNDNMKLSVNKPKSNCATIQLVLISEFAFGPEKLPDLSRNGPQVPERPISTNAETKFVIFAFYHLTYCLE